MAKNIADIRAYEMEIDSLERESGEIFIQAESYRLSAIPNIEQFRLGLYHSLHAEELYSSPDFIPEVAVSDEWIKNNIIALFTEVL